MQLWPLIMEICMIVSAIAIALGWYFIRQGKRETHRRLMLVGSAFAVAFFVNYVLRTVIVGDTTFGGPTRWATAYQIFLQAHATLATVAAVLGIITLRRAFLQRFQLHRKIGPWTATTWLVAAASGLVVFLLLYVIYPPGPNTNLFRAITVGLGRIG
jgi:putative membrane protein